MDNQTMVRYLSEHDFFSDLNQSAVGFLCQHARAYGVDKGQVLFRQDERAEKFYIVYKGRVSIQIPALMGPTLQVQVLGKDQILGWSWFISPYQWSFQAIFEEDSELLEFDGVAILAHCESNPKFGYELLKRFSGLMSERLDAARLTMIDEWNPEGFA